LFDGVRVAVFDQWEIDHGPETGWQLIEPVDGFHPNQVGRHFSPLPHRHESEYLYTQSLK